jgi:hypothetical protein
VSGLAPEQWREHAGRLRCPGSFGDAVADAVRSKTVARVAEQRLEGVSDVVDAG